MSAAHANGVTPAPLVNPYDEAAPVALPPLDLQAEDGPVFRTQLAQLERKAASLRASIKALVKAAEGSLEALSAYHDSETTLDAAFVHLAASSESIGQLQSVYLKEARVITASSRRDALTALEEGVVSPLRRLQAHLKEAETRRKPFDAESKLFYDATARYLAKSDEDKRGSEKHALRAAKFAMARFEYLVVLQDAAIYSEAQLLTILTHWTRLEHTLTINEANNLSGTLQNALDRFTGHCVEQVDLQVQACHEKLDRRRKDLEAQYRRSATEAGEPVAAGAGFSEALDRLIKVKPTGAGAIPLIRDPGDSDGGKKDASKEGMLWASSASDSTAKFHKYWVILSARLLTDYIGWREELEIHGSPIPLRFATVKEAKLQDRRFAFEVITSDSRRIYQATSEAEAKSWQQAIASAIEQVLLNGSDTTPRTASPPILQSGLGIGGGGKHFNPLGRRASGKNGAHRKRDSAAQFLQSGLAHLGIGPRDRHASGSGPPGGGTSPPLFHPHSGLLHAATDEASTSDRSRSRSEGSSQGSEGSDFDRQIALSVEHQTLLPSPLDSERPRTSASCWSCYHCRTISGVSIVGVLIRAGHHGR